MTDNLPELRDIHLPEGVSFWPPAYGWYVIIIAIVLAFVIRRYYRLWRLKSRKLYAVRLLENLDGSNIVTAATQISEILRRVCVYRYPQAVALNGTAWLEFIKAHGSQKISPETAELLQNAPYLNPKTAKYKPQDLEKLIGFAKDWIGENL